MSPAVILCRLWLRSDAFEEEPDRELPLKTVSNQHVAALISGVTAVWPTHNEPDAEHLYSSAQEKYKYGLSKCRFTCLQAISLHPKSFGVSCLLPVICVLNILRGVSQSGPNEPFGFIVLSLRFTLVMSTL